MDGDYSEISVATVDKATIAAQTEIGLGANEIVQCRSGRMYWTPSSTTFNVVTRAGERPQRGKLPYLRIRLGQFGAGRISRSSHSFSQIMM